MLDTGKGGVWRRKEGEIMIESVCVCLSTEIALSLEFRLLFFGRLSPWIVAKSLSTAAPLIACTTTESKFHEPPNFQLPFLAPSVPGSDIKPIRRSSQLTNWIFLGCLLGWNERFSLPPLLFIKILADLTDLLGEQPRGANSLDRRNVTISSSLSNRWRISSATVEQKARNEYKFRTREILFALLDRRQM